MVLVRWESVIITENHFIITEIEMAICGPNRSTISGDSLLPQSGRIKTAPDEIIIIMTVVITGNRGGS